MERAVGWKKCHLIVINLQYEAKQRALERFEPTPLFLHFHHLPFPLIKSGDVLGVFAAPGGIRVCGDGGALVLSRTMRRPELGRLI